jgi:hypothetical protein
MEDSKEDLEKNTKKLSSTAATEPSPPHAPKALLLWAVIVLIGGYGLSYVPFLEEEGPHIRAGVIVAALIAIITVTLPKAKRVVNLLTVAAFLAGGLAGFLSGQYPRQQGTAEEPILTQPPEQALQEAVNLVAKSGRGKRWNTVRFFGNTSSQFLPAFRASGLEADKMLIILRETSDENTQMKLTTMIRNWCELKDQRKIGALTIQTGSFVPLEYDAIFDHEIMISGLFWLDKEDKVNSGAKVQTPMITRGQRDPGRRKIEEYIERFDRVSTYIGKTQGCANDAR